MFRRATVHIHKAARRLRVPGKIAGATTVATGAVMWEHGRPGGNETVFHDNVTAVNALAGGILGYAFYPVSLLAMPLVAQDLRRLWGRKDKMPADKTAAATAPAIRWAPTELDSPCGLCGGYCGFRCRV